MAPHWKLVQFAAEQTHAYNLFGMNWWADEAEMIFCELINGACDHILEAFADADTSVDNLDRYERFLKDFPAGSPFQDLAHFA